VDAGLIDLLTASGKFSAVSREIFNEYRVRVEVEPEGDLHQTYHRVRSDIALLLDEHEDAISGIVIVHSRKRRPGTRQEFWERMRGPRRSR